MTDTTLDARSNWHSKLIEITGKINGLFIAGEQSKNALTQDFASIIQKIGEHSEKVTTVSANIQNGKGLNIELFQKLYNGMESSVNNTFNEMITSLNELVGQIGQILTLKTTLEEVSHSIKNVSLLMKVKSSKVIQSEFDHVVVGLEGLSVRIKENTEGISLSAIDAKESILSLTEDMNARLVSFKRVYTKSKAELKQLFDAISIVFEEMKGKINLINRNVNQIENMVKDAQSSTTFHSISYQSLSDVTQRLNNMVSTLNDTEEEGEDEEKWLNVFKEDVSSTKITVEDVSQRVVDNTGKLTVMFKNVVEKVADQVEVSQKVESAVKDVDQKINHIDQLFHQISDTLSLSEEQTAVLLDSISNINQNVIAVSKQVSTIEVTRNDLEALTYNAVFKAAKVGARGKVMGTITDEITSLSREVQAKITDKEQVISSIVNSSKRFKATVSDRLNEQLTIIRETNETVHAETHRFLDECEKILDMSRIFDQLENNVSKTREDMNLNPRILNDFDEIKKQLRTIFDMVNFKMTEIRELKAV